MNGLLSSITALGVRKLVRVDAVAALDHRRDRPTVLLTSGRMVDPWRSFPFCACQ
jgi:hypothetical protein